MIWRPVIVVPTVAFWRLYQLTGDVNDLNGFRWRAYFKSDVDTRRCTDINFDVWHNSGLESRRCNSNRVVAGDRALER